MDKIFTTQLIGRLQKIQELELEIEDGARLLAQAFVSDGNIYIYAEDELAAVYLEAKYGEEPMKRVERLTEEQIGNLSSVDRVLLVTRDAHCEKAVAIGEKLRAQQIPFVAMGSVKDKENNVLEDLAHAFIDLQLDKGLVPAMTGTRKGFPHGIVALFAYHQLKLTLDEIMEDFA